uniref:Predicted transcriptional regulator n=1 Tax=uncultured Thiotrichaceae bacterium TaxID=298394 RepID=A0A6S6ULH7_9GAMM|nr:MAG: Predicted transcriptional regulator [uncultured Thiotrichaceae bacterium]
MTNILKIEIRPATDALDAFGKTLQQLEAGKTAEPHFSIGFENVPQFAKVFTAKRWELISKLRETGAVSIYELAKRLDRHYRNVHQDVSLLSEWLVIEKNDQGKVHVPWDEIDVRLPLPAAA